MASEVSEPADREARSLVVSVLGVQLEFYSIEQLMEGFLAWMDQPQRALEDLLIERQIMTRSIRELLTVLSARYIEHLGGVQNCLESMSSYRALHERMNAADPGRHGDGSDKTVIQTVIQSAAPLSTAAESPYRADHAARREMMFHSGNSEQNRFRIVRPFKKGGLGEVFVADDVQLNREVALKEIQAYAADDPESRSRFRREAQVTGRLEHPGIVPVYGFGQYDDGRPYYAMRMVSGDTFETAINRFHLDASVGSGNHFDEAGLSSLRKLLRRLIDVCNAIEYAHSRGFLHRDLKPGNIILGSYGETIVLDWGLAKPINTSDVGGPLDEPMPPKSGPEYGAGKFSGEMGTNLTSASSILGTPAYMSPEQAIGDLRQLGPATDIYGLGATLYHLLTGQTPFNGVGKHELIRAVIQGELTSPRQINPRIPGPLESICLKAMSRLPVQRYSTPLELIEDLECWLADERVEAHEESWAEQTARFIRRHRAWTVSALVAVAIIAFVAVTSLILINRSRNKAEAAVIRESNERKRAELGNEVRKEAYISNVRLAETYWNTNLTRASNQALRDCMPSDGEPDLRGWEWYFQRNRSEQCLLSCNVGEFQNRNPHQFTQYGVFGVAFSPDATRFAVTQGYSVQIRDGATGETLRTLTVSGKIENGLFERVSFGANGSAVYAAGNEAVFCWNSESGKLIREFTYPDVEGFYDLTLSPDESRLLASGYDGAMYEWNAVSGDLLGVFAIPKVAARCVAYSSDGSLIAGGFSDGTLRIWDTATQSVRSSLRNSDTVIRRGLQVTPHAIAIHPDNSRVYVGLSDSTVEVWNLDSKTKTHKWEPHTDDVTCLRLNADGSVLICGSVDQTLAVIRSDDGRLIRRIRGHQDRITSLALSRDQRRVISVSLDGNVRIQDMRGDPACRIIETSRNLNYQIRASADGRFIAWADQFVTTVADARTARTLLTVPTLHGKLCFSADGNRLFIGGAVWDTTGRAILRRFYDTPTGYADASVVDLSPDGEQLALIIDDRIVVYQVNDGSILRESSKIPSRFMDMEFDTSGKHLYCAGNNIVRWNVEQNEFDSSWRVPEEAAVIALCEKRQLVAAGLPGGSIMFWNSVTGESLGRLQGHSQQVTDVGFNSDGSRLVSGSMDRTVKVWDTVKMASVCTLDRHTDCVTGVCFSHDGHQIHSSGWDGTVRTWYGNPELRTFVALWNAASTQAHAVNAIQPPNPQQSVLSVIEGDRFLTDEERGIAFAVMGARPADIASPSVRESVELEYRRYQENGVLLPIEALQAYLARNDERLAELTKVVDEKFPGASVLRRKIEHLRALLNPVPPIALADVSPAEAVIGVSRLKFETEHVGWASVLRDQSLIEAGQSPLLEVDGNFYESGLWAHAPSVYSLRLKGAWKQFRSGYGLRLTGQGSVVFVVKGDGKELFRSERVDTSKMQTVRSVDVDVEGVDLLELIVEDGGDGAFRDWSVWLAPELRR
ncbi:MAG: NPCBM/NEW2 domain-containing protein [Planctomyces sp.]|nr:NPCBM/NEW2 domain-containing protein [Planctomyces sp.]